MSSPRRRRRWRNKTPARLPVTSRAAPFTITAPSRWIIASDCLKTSMTAQVFIRIAQVKDALRVPVAALGRSLGDERYLVVVQKENGSEERTIRIGINDRQYAQVLEGLQPGERVVIPQDAGSV